LYAALNIMLMTGHFPAKGTDVSLAGTSVQIDLMVVIGFWTGKLEALRPSHRICFVTRLTADKPNRY